MKFEEGYREPKQHGTPFHDALQGLIKRGKL